MIRFLNKLVYLISLLSTPFFHQTVWSQTNTSERKLSSRFDPGCVFFQHVNTRREDYLNHLRLTIENPKTPEKGLALARCELAVLTEDPKSASATIESEFGKLKIPEISNHLCRCRLRAGDFAAGEELCRAVIKSNPNNTDAHLLLCSVTKRITPDVLEIATTDPYAWMVMAGVFGSQNSYQECADAVRHYLEFKKIGPLMLEEYPHTTLGKALFKLGRRDLETAKTLETAFELSTEFKRSPPKKRSELAVLISACYGSLNQNNDALQWAETGYELDPDSTDANFALGTAIVILRQGDSSFTYKDELAVTCLSKVLHRTQNLEIAWDLARFLELKGKQNEAISVLRPLVTMDTDISIRLHLAALILTQEKISEADIEFSQKTLLENLSISHVALEYRKGFIACLIRVGDLHKAREAVRELREMAQTAELREEVTELNKLIEKAEIIRNPF